MSGDLVRLQGYLSSHLISYIVHDPGWFPGSCGQFSDWFTSGCAAWFLGVIIAVLITLTHQHMSNTPFFNPTLVKDISSEQIDRLDAICYEYTSRFFNKETTDNIMSTLKHCRGINRHHADFRGFNGVYWHIKRYSSYSDYVTFRKYLQTLSAIYRWHFGSFQHYCYRDSLHERIKVETHCEHCGSLGKGLIDWLISENLWLV